MSDSHGGKILRIEIPLGPQIVAEILDFRPKTMKICQFLITFHQLIDTGIWDKQ